jgi:rod shape-determining protein MreC
MSKKLVLLLTILFIIVAYIFNVDRMIKNQLSTFQTYVTTNYLNTIVFISSNFNKYINQISYIEQLKKQTTQLQEIKIQHEILKNKFNELERTNPLNESYISNFKKISVLSYKNFLEKSIINLEQQTFPKDYITGLITPEGYSAGIVLNQNNRTVSFLNENKKCNYAVFIGENYAPGITSGKNYDGKLIIKHIPLWKKIKKGDKIITSGMDAIFPYGVNVGEVLEIEKLDNTQKVYAKTYGETINSRHFYLYIKEIK